MVVSQSVGDAGMRFTISHARGVQAPVGREERLSLEELASLARRTKAGHKEDLPMLVAGTFDETRSRKTEHMLTVTAIMGDYDAGDMRPEEAAAKLKAANVAGAIITSPRHEMEGMKGNAQRWRVICPVSNPVTTREHFALARRLNGIFGQDVLGVEGVTPSRPYYYGSLVGRAPCESYVVDGRPIDAAKEIQGLRFPRTEHDKILFPAVDMSGDAGKIAEAVLEAACQFSGGHEGLRPACMLVAPFVRINALDGSLASARLQEQLEATASRGSVPPNEAERTLRWCMASDNVTEAAGALELSVLLGELSVEAATRQLAIACQDPIADFGALEALEAAEASASMPKPDTTKDDDLEKKIAEANAKKFTFLSDRDLDNLPEPTWLVNGVLPEIGRIYLWGPPKSGKSFVAISLALAVAHGAPWFGRETQGGVVVYAMGEGVHGAGRRLAAARAAYGLDFTDNLIVLPRAPQLKKDTEAFASAIQTRIGDRKVRLIIVDTLARSAIGVDENSSQEMGELGDCLDWLYRRFDCAVMPVHHSGKDSARGMRGSNAMDGAADCAIQVKREGVGGPTPARWIEVINQYQKEAEEFEPLYFDLVANDFTGSLALGLRAGKPSKEGSQFKRSDQKTEAVISTLIDMRETIPNSPVTIHDLSEACADNMNISKAAQRKDRAKAARATIAALLEEGLIRQDGDNLYTATETGGDG